MPKQPRFRCIDRDAYPFTYTPQKSATRTMGIPPERPDIPDKDPEDITFEDLEEMGLHEGAFMLGQIRAHEIATSIKMGQLCAAVGLPPTQENAPALIDEVRNKIFRLEQERREGSALENLLRDAIIEDMGPIIFGYSNGFHAATAQLAKIVALTHIDHQL